MKHNSQKILTEKRKANEQWFQNNLKTIRLLCGITLGDICKNTGISIQTLSLIERGTKKISFYQYIVIRRYIDSYLTDSLRHELYDTTYKDDFISELLKSILSVAISVIRNDMGIWSENEQNYIIKQWELLKSDYQDNDDAKTAKTYSKVFTKSFGDFGVLKIAKPIILFIDALKIELANGFPTFKTDNNGGLDYINFIESIDGFSPIEKISSFVIFETIIIIIFAIPCDETAALSHLALSKENIEQIESQDEKGISLEKIFSLEKMLKLTRNSFLASTTPDQASATLDDLVDNTSDVMKELFSLPFYSFSEEENNYPPEKKIEILTNDWLNIIRIALLKLIDANDWFFSSTSTYIDNIPSINTYSSFLDYIDKEYSLRGNLNIQEFKEYIAKIEE